MDVNVQIVRAGAKIPARHSEDATGFDLYAHLAEQDQLDFVRLTQHPTLVPTGIAMSVPSSVDAQIRPRSGLSSEGVIVALGTLDPDYRGELFVTMYTTTDRGYSIKHGERIAQIVFNMSYANLVELRQVVRLDETVRGSRGHGSSGRM